MKHLCASLCALALDSAVFALHTAMTNDMQVARMHAICRQPSGIAQKRDRNCHLACSFSFAVLLIVAVKVLIKSIDSILAAAPELLPVRIIAAIALIAVIVAFVHVLRHLKSIERTIVKDDLMPIERGPRDK